jgi:hypothetical protein
MKVARRPPTTIYGDYGREYSVCRPEVHPCERGEHCAAAYSEGATVNEVSDEAEEGVDYVRYFAVFLQNDFFDG